MTFDSAHFGEGHLNESHPTFDASRLYSALFQEALKLHKEEAFLILSQDPLFVLSDAFPYINGQPYLPKPIGYPEYKENDSDDLKKVRQQAKKVKKINYIPISRFNDYLNQSASIDELVELQKQATANSYVTKKGNDPYEVGITTYNSSLYILASQSELFDLLIESLQHSGLGGKRTSGYGQFSVECLDMPEDFKQHLSFDSDKVSMLLTTSIPKEEELVKSMTSAYYLIKKSSGFLYSETSKEQLRKQDLFKFNAGSTFQYSFKGSIVDVRPDAFPHPVWNFSKGLFYKIE